MALQYSTEALLKLRESPLVCKPVRLPPVEEWMGPISDQSRPQSGPKTMSRGKNEEPSTIDGAATRRTPFEARTKSTNVPEDIVLGPPKISFASASGMRSANKTYDSPRRPSFTKNDENIKERNNFKDRFSRESHKYEKDGEKPRETKQDAAQNRRSVKDDGDRWLSTRHSRTSGQDDNERPHKQNGDRDLERDRDNGRGLRSQRGFDNHRRDRNSDVNGETSDRRNGGLRSLNESSWHKDEGSKDGDEAEIGSSRNRDWNDRERRGTRGADRDWGRGNKQELEPEWSMDEPQTEGKGQGHTQEDLEAFKAQMRLANGVTNDTKAEDPPSHARVVSGGANVPVKTKVDTPLVMDSTDDGFFGLLSKPRVDMGAVNDDGSSVQTNLGNGTTKASKASKFSALFTPKPEAESAPQQLPVSPPQDSSSEDKQGFERILTLLGQQQRPSETPPRSQPQRDMPASPPVQSPRGGAGNDYLSFLGSRSPPVRPTTQTPESEFLLGLMKHQPPELNQNSNSRRQDPPPGLIPFSNLMMSPETPQQIPSIGPPLGFYHESTKDEMQTRDKLNPNANAERRGFPPGFFEVPNQRQRSSHQSGLPPGMQRPPGLEIQMPPGYAQHPQAHRQSMIPPPGFQAPRGQQNMFTPNIISNMSGSNDRGSQYGIRPNGSNMPPPGFMNGPPPGFSNVPFNQDGVPFGGFGDAQFGQGFTPAQQRRQ